ncbi:hypothetical protein J14TS2_15850 [Bacillus sp. J14TS2]|uniref:hypothetical protein n=1 Tax=Bacillus sp. J14TS2 TaxID=2807188 RepID=UPI001B123FBB|nr:hypothetical protein [Bacillus sp. J14TS2]GIN71110.1 hypothetical protein J14TS2_15850 [Bacillus sp. J14TS2]
MLIPEHEEPTIEKAIFLPLLIKILNHDLKAIAQSQIKLKEPYYRYVEKVMHAIQQDSYKNKKYMRDNNIKIYCLSHTKYEVIYKGYGHVRTYAKHVLKTRSKELLEDYMLNRKSRHPSEW